MRKSNGVISVSFQFEGALVRNDLRHAARIWIDLGCDKYHTSLEAVRQAGPCRTIPEGSHADWWTWKKDLVLVIHNTPRGQAVTLFYDATHRHGPIRDCNGKARAIRKSQAETSDHILVDP